MAIYAYYRVSTKTQAEKNSTEMQKDVVKSYCKENGLAIDGVFEDDGVSGAMDDMEETIAREGLIELFSTAQEGDTIIVQNTSRLWRSDTAKVIIRREIKKCGANLISVEQKDYDLEKKDPNNFLVNGLLELLDEYDKISIAVKLAKGRKARAKTGNKPCGNAPIGYRWNGNKIEIDYNNHLIVQDIFNMCLERKGNLSQIMRDCMDKGYKTTRGKDFSVQAIKNILKNDFYIGVVTYAEKKANGEHEPIIEKSVFEKVSEILRGGC